MHCVIPLKCKLVSDMDKGKENVALVSGGKIEKKLGVMLELQGSRNNSTLKLYVGGHK